MSLDWARPMTQRRHPGHGFLVTMYKDAPGEYFDERGEELDPDVASAAGFDTDYFAREAKRQREMAAAIKAVNDKFQHLVAGEVVEVLAGGKLRIVCTGPDSFDVVDADGAAVNPTSLDRKAAHALARDLSRKGASNGTA